MKAELIDMLCRKSFKYSKEPIYKLVSGRMSQFYVNCKPHRFCLRIEGEADKCFFHSQNPQRSWNDPLD
jgi:hypothetical protein